jgi:isorenieratene synthase
MGAVSGPGPWLRGLARRAVRAAMGGYRVDVVRADPSRPARLDQPRRVAVVGGGIAGMTAAEVLARRGFTVVLLERNAELGGKIGSELGADPEGRPVRVDHGFHAFFRHYENLAAFLARAGIAPMRAIDDYVIVGDGGGATSFREVETAPLLNVLSLGARGFFTASEVAPRRTRTRMHELLRYDPVRTFRDLDDVSFAAFADDAGLPPKLRRVFGTFARAFFAEDHRLSAAELVKAFHFYYLSHDSGLLYDYPAGDADETLVQPLRRHLAGLGVEVRCNTPVAAVEAGTSAITIDGEGFDDLVLAAPAMATRDIVQSSPGLSRAIPRAAARLALLERGARYAVLRVWLDRDPCAAVPVFVSTDRHRLLDAVASCHRVTRADAAWAERSRGAVLELHSYAVPDDVADAQLRPLMLSELALFFPEAARAEVLGAHLAVRDDFTARHVGMAKHRPPTTTEDPRVVLAGDWVDLPTPALLMEGACTAGLFAANALATRQGLSPEPIASVPLRGVLHAVAPR